jgi:hypothetical protein
VPGRAQVTTSSTITIANESISPYRLPAPLQIHADAQKISEISGYWSKKFLEAGKNRLKEVIDFISEK